jgi:hypothetical protein
MLGGCEALGATHCIQASRYSNEVEFDATTIRLEDVRRQLC